MSETKIKLCGMFRMQDIAVINTLKPDYAGFVFYPPSHRNISVAQAMAMREALHSSIKAVGVFVDSPARLVAKLLNDGVIDAAQLHGHEDAAYIAQLRRQTEKPIIQAIKIRTAEDGARAEASAADWVLLDNGLGTGERFDWSLIQTVRRPYFLAGGLDADNIAEAVRQLHPYAVDVSSGIETNKLKDADKMQRFVQAVRNADACERS